MKATTYQKILPKKPHNYLKGVGCVKTHRHKLMKQFIYKFFTFITAIGILFGLSFLLPDSEVVFGATNVNIYWQYDATNTTLYLNNQSYTGNNDDIVTENNVGWENHKNEITKIVIENTIQPCNLSNYMQNMTALTEIVNIHYLDTGNATNMENMFYNCISLASIDVSHFNTSNVTNMNYMFCKCSRITSLDISTFDTSKVTSSLGMFYQTNLENLKTPQRGSVEINLPHSMYDAADTKFTVMPYNTELHRSFVFYKVDKSTHTLYLNNKSYTGDSSDMVGITIPWANASQTTTNVIIENEIFPEDASSYFSNMINLESLDLSNLNTSHLTSLQNMFRYARNLKQLDLSMFDTSKITNMNHTFDGCLGLEVIDLSSFDIQSNTTVEDLFTDCDSLKTIYTPKSGRTDIPTGHVMQDENNEFYLHLPNNKILNKVVAPNYLLTGTDGDGGNTVFYNMDYNNVTYITYCLNHSKVGLSGQYSDLYDISHFNNDNNVWTKIQNVVAVGYPSNKTNLYPYIKDTLQISEEEASKIFRQATQYAIWHYSDCESIEATSETVQLLAEKIVEIVENQSSLLNPVLNIRVSIPEQKFKQNALILSIPENPITIIKTDNSGNPLPNAVFGVYTEDNKLLDNGLINHVPVDAVCWTTDTNPTVINIPNGSYIIREISAPTGYEKVDSIPLIVSDGYGQYITISNAPIDDLSETVDISVFKQWTDDDGGEVLGNNIPVDSVTIYLKNGDTIVRTAILNGASDWRYTFTDVPKYANNKQIDYMIEEEPNDLYRAKIIQTDTYSFKITNEIFPLPCIVVGKVVSGDQGDYVSPFTFQLLIKPNESSLPFGTSVNGYINKNDENIPITVTVGVPYTFELAHYEEIVIFQIPYNIEFEISEQISSDNPNEYDISIYDDAMQYFNGEPASIHDNKYSGITQDDVVVIFQNDKSSLPPTSVNINVYPFIFLTLCSSLYLIFFRYYDPASLK